MGHCIQIIIAPISSADSISKHWPELPRLNHGNGFAILPVSSELIDQQIPPDLTLPHPEGDWMMLSNGFRSYLRLLSHGGELAYVETDYFGGVGGQGALVCRDGVEIMPPDWNSTGVINRALKLLGIQRGILADEFVRFGLDKFRDEDDILDLIARQSREPNS